MQPLSFSRKLHLLLWTNRSIEIYIFGGIYYEREN